MTEYVTPNDVDLSDAIEEMTDDELARERAEVQERLAAIRAGAATPARTPVRLSARLARLSEALAARDIATAEAEHRQTAKARRDMDALGELAAQLEHGTYATAIGLAHVLGVTRQRVYQLMVAEDFPAPLPSVIGCRVWSVAEVLAWKTARAEANEQRESEIAQRKAAKRGRTVYTGAPAT